MTGKDSQNALGDDWRDHFEAKRREMHFGNVSDLARARNEGYMQGVCDAIAVASEHEHYLHKGVVVKCMAESNDA